MASVSNESSSINAQHSGHTKNYSRAKNINKVAPDWLGLSISCSETFGQLFRFGATFSPLSNFSDLVQLFFWTTFLLFYGNLLLETAHSSSYLKNRLLLCILRKIPFLNKKTLFPWWSACGSSRTWSADMLENWKWRSRALIHARALVKMMNIQILSK